VRAERRLSLAKTARKITSKEMLIDGNEKELIEKVYPDISNK
jgi:hypothetical protein